MCDAPWLVHTIFRKKGDERSCLRHTTKSPSSLHTSSFSFHLVPERAVPGAAELLLLFGTSQGLPRPITSKIGDCYKHETKLSLTPSANSMYVEMTLQVKAISTLCARRLVQRTAEQIYVYCLRSVIVVRLETNVRTKIHCADVTASSHTCSQRILP